MEKEKVLEKLKQINYPGFNRDIVSFGMVKDITVDNNIVKLELSISSQNEEKKQEVIKSVKEKLSTEFTKVEISLKTDVSATSSPQQSSSTKPILDNVKHVIAIASGKGGVGKSTIATNLACALSRKGGKIGLLDLDIYGPSLPILLGVNEQPKMTEDNKLIPIKKFGMEIMSFGFISGNDTPVIWRGPLVSRMTEQFFRDVAWGDLDILLLDLPPGTGDIQLTLTQKLRMTGAVIITTPQDIALADVRKGADMFRKVNTPVLGVIENMSGLVINGKVNPPEASLEINGKPIQKNKNGDFEIKFDIFKVGGGKKESERLGVPLLGQIPISEEIMLSADKGTPVTLDDEPSKMGQTYSKIAENILNNIKQTNVEH